jgi:hypothetical protein
MARISTYIIDQPVDADDKWIGTAFGLGTTKNFTARGVASFLNTSSSIAGQTNFFFQTNLNPGRLKGSISFLNGGGVNTPFSSLISIKVSKYSYSDNLIAEYLQTMVGSNIIISQTDDINKFGVYKLNNLTQDPVELDFLDASLELVISNGALLFDKFYTFMPYSSGVTDLSYTPGILNGIVNSSTGTDAVIPLAGLVNAGLFSAAEKSKLDGLELQNLQKVVNIGNSISNYGGIGNASIQSTNFSNNRTLYLNNNSHPTIKLEDNLDGNHYTVIDIDTLNLSGVSYPWSSIVEGSQNLQDVTDEGAITTNSIQLIDSAEVLFGTGGGILLDNASRLREGTIDAGLGGSKGIAQICGIGYELKWEAGRLYVMNGNGNGIRGSLYNFNIVPTVDDDNTKAYYIGSLWSLDNGDVYECLDATTGAAVWDLKNTGSTPNLQQVTDEGATTDNTITINPTVSTNGLNINTTWIDGEPSSKGINIISAGENTGIYINNSINGNAIYALGNNNDVTAYINGGDTGLNLTNIGSTGIAVSGGSSESINVYNANGDVGLRVYQNLGDAILLNLSSTSSGITINSGLSSVGNTIVINKNGVEKLVVNQAGELTAQKLIKDGGFDFQFLKADGSVDNNTYLTSADLPSTLDLYATTSPDPIIAGYTALVRNIADARYNTDAADVLTPLVDGTIASPTFCGAVISDPSVLLGNPGVFNFTVIGNIRRVSGSTSSGADFFYSIYKRDLAGTEVFIADGAKVPVPANGGLYIEYISTALWNNGIFLSTDRIVLKFYGIQTGGGTGAYYEFLFGGADPVRGTAAISSAIIPNIYLKDLADVEKTPALDNEILYWNDSASLWEHSEAVDLIPDATTTQRGLMSTGTQTFAGDKTFTGTTAGISKSMVGLSNVDNTTDLLKPISTATQNALDLKSNDNDVVHLTGAETIAGIKTFSSSPIAPTSATGTNNTELATNEFVTNAINTATPGTGYTVYNILITKSENITTQTTGTSGGVPYVQNGRNVMINNGATAITIDVTNAVTDFIASYTKIGNANITFIGTGITFVNSFSGVVLNGLSGSTALLVKNGSNVYLSINNIIT